MATNYHGFEKLSSLGWLTSITFISGTFVLVSHCVYDYQISQSISEIGEKGAQLNFFSEIN
jgi:hypothetical protein